MIEIFNYSLFTFRIKGEKALGIFFWAAVTTAVRYAAVYGLVRVVLLALHHGGVF